MQNKTIELFGQKWGNNHPPLIIAEISGNHGGRIENALAMIEAAAQAGAGAIKIQSYTPDTITIDHDGPGFLLKDGLWQGKTLYELYQTAHTPWDWHEALFNRARELSVPLFSSPFDATAVDMLESHNCPAYKIASFELVDVGLIEKVAKTGKPVIMSTGMASLDEIEEAVSAFRAVPVHGELVLLHCTSGYPTPVSEANLRAIPVLSERFGVPVGLSDHTQGNTVAVASIAMGACVVEKHFMLDGMSDAVDSAFSLNPAEFKNLVDTCNDAYSALGRADFSVTEAEKVHLTSRRSLYVTESLKKGQLFSTENIRSIRPGGGLHPRELKNILGRKAQVDIQRGTPLSLELVAKDDDGDV